MLTVESELEEDARRELQSQDVTDSTISIFSRAHIRYDGTDMPIQVDLSDARTMTREFEKLHRKQFGFVFENKQLIVEAIEVEAVGGGAGIEEPEHDLVDPMIASHNVNRIFSNGRWHDAGICKRSDLKPGHRLMGPALIIEPNQTIVVEPGWQAEITKLNHIVLTRAQAMQRAHAIGTEADPVMLEVFNNLFMSIAEQMGVTLQNTAYSVNIKERLDFSCAIFGPDGSLVANAPHMPVHLGSMDRSVETVIALNKGNINPGDVFILNAPYNGGTHLPDITVVTPVFDEPSGSVPASVAGQASATSGNASPQTDEGPDGTSENEKQNIISPEIIFWVAARGHHADVGGMAPGSATPRATHIDEEGVLIDNFKLVERGIIQEDGMRKILTDHPWPARNPDQNMADIRAHIAANEMGVNELAQDGRSFLHGRGQGLCWPCPGQCRGKRAPCHRCPCRLPVHLSDRQRPADQRQNHRRQGQTRGYG